MTVPIDGPRPLSLAALGWSDFFVDQLAPGEGELARERIAAVHRARLTTLSETGPAELVLPARANTGDFAVGDWVLADPLTRSLRRRLARRTLLERHMGGGQPTQLAGANIDTLFIVTSCDADFNLARLERYLAFANQAGTEPVIVLTKADSLIDASQFETQAAGLQRGLAVVTVNARSADAAAALARWCATGNTVAVVGSSGVGKSTLVNSLAGAQQELPQLTGTTREHDSKGRHTTTSRSLHAIAGGGWVIDTPGMRGLRVSEAGGGLDTLFAEIIELAGLCRFRDCTHVHEPGCAVQAAIASGELDPERVARWRKLAAENRGAAPVQTSQRSAAARARGKAR